MGTLLTCHTSPSSWSSSSPSSPSPSPWWRPGPGLETGLEMLILNLPCRAISTEEERRTVLQDTSGTTGDRTVSDTSADHQQKIIFIVTRRVIGNIVFIYNQIQ